MRIPGPRDKAAGCVHSKTKRKRQSVKVGGKKFVYYNKICKRCGEWVGSEDRRGRKLT